MLDKKIKAAMEVIDKVVSEFHGTRKDHVVITSSMQIIATALDSPNDQKKVKVPRKALSRDRKRKGKGKK